MSLIIGICGGSCSGKTTLASHIEARLGSGQCARLAQDDYYFPMDSLTFDCPLPNFDHPSTVNFDDIAKDLLALKRGETIVPPKYDFTTHSHVQSHTALSPKPVILIEGLLLLTSDQLCDIFDHSYFVECGEDLRFERRLSRDVTSRGRDPDEIRWQFKTHVAPMHNTFIEPSKTRADRIITQNEYMTNIETLCDSMIAKWLPT